MVRGCVEILTAATVDEEFLVVLAGPAAQQVLNGREGGVDGYWPRVWAARGLLHVWEDVAAPAVIRATADASWRVREMAAKVIGRHAVGDGLDALAALQSDPVARVRAAATQSIEVIVGLRA